MPQEETLEDIRNNIVGECNIGLKDVRYQPIIFLLPLGDIEDESIEDTVWLDEKRL